MEAPQKVELIPHGPTQVLLFQANHDALTSPGQLKRQQLTGMGFGQVVGSGSGRVFHTLSATTCGKPVSGRKDIK